MALDRIDALLEAVMRAQPRAVAVGAERQRVKLSAGQHAVACDAIDMRLATLARQRLAQRDIVRPQVARRELRRLVLDCVRLVIRHGLGSVRDLPLLALRAVWMCTTSGMQVSKAWKGALPTKRKPSTPDSKTEKHP